MDSLVPFSRKLKSGLRAVSCLYVKQFRLIYKSSCSSILTQNLSLQFVYFPLIVRNFRAAGVELAESAMHLNDEILAGMDKGVVDSSEGVTEETALFGDAVVD